MLLIQWRLKIVNQLLLPFIPIILKVNTLCMDMGCPKLECLFPFRVRRLQTTLEAICLAYIERVPLLIVGITENVESGLIGPFPVHFINAESEILILASRPSAFISHDDYSLAMLERLCYHMPYE